jgi:SAM-dependent methyltransferase
MDWHQGFFDGEGWVDLHQGLFPDEHTEHQADGVVRLADLKAGAQVLDAPCGEGRIARALARRGMLVTAVDASEPLLELARERSAGLPVAYGRDDLRSLGFSDQFDAVVCIWSSFGYFDRAGDLAFAQAARRALVLGGRFVIDTHTTETLFPKMHDRTWSRSGTTVALEDRRYDPVTGRLQIDWTFLRDGREEHARSSVRLYGCAELCSLLREAGFGEFAAYGGFDGSPLKVGSEHLVLVAA